MSFSSSLLLVLDPGPIYPKTRISTGSRFREQITQSLGKYLAFRDNVREENNEGGEANEMRFAVALSFAGEYRDFVRGVANILANTFGRERVFFDEFHPDIKVVNADLLLQDWYGNQSELIVPFFCTQYDKTWCDDIEGRAIRGVINGKESWRVYLTSFDGEVPSWVNQNTDLFEPLGGKSHKEVAELIFDRHKTIKNRKN